MAYHIGVDSGGTFTDIVSIDSKGTITFEKAFSTPDNPARGVSGALENLAQRLDVAVGDVLKQTDRFAHGTTVATNALIQRRGAKVGLLMTKGFEDTILMTRGPMGRTMGIPPTEAMDFVHTDRPEPLVPAELIRGVSERVGVDGQVLAPLDDEEVAESVRELLNLGVDSLAVCLMWSFVNSSHERRIKQIIHDLRPGFNVNLSSEISPLMGEFERVVTTTVNAYVAPVMRKYINTLQQDLSQRGLQHPVQLMTSAGGVTLPRHIERESVATVNSGPVGGLVAAKFLGEILGYQNILTTDMGGTSFDVGVISRGEYEYDKVPFVSQGIPLQVPMVRVVAIGAGGGSIAWTDGRRLLVGHQSAGADPGPACYDQGGQEPTVTDALVALGILDPDYFFGGRKRLKKELSEKAIRTRVAEPLGLDLLRAAEGIYEVVTAKMSDLIRKVTVESGYDPREFILFAYGGAAPAHCALYGSALGVGEVVVPETAAVFSALGAALSDIKYTYAKSEPLSFEPTPAIIERFNMTFSELRARVLEDMSSLGLAAKELLFTFGLDLRYAGQLNEVTVPWESKALTEESFAEIRRTFDEIYAVKFGPETVRKGSPLELITFRIEALRPVEKPALRPDPEVSGGQAPTPKGRRTVYLPRVGATEIPVYDFSNFEPGMSLMGPAIIERSDTTILIPPGQEARIDGFRNVRIRMRG